jgi:predicted alpha-1,2-mannosidase
LIRLFGGEKAFTRKLDSLFVIQAHLGEEASNDITGLIGQYAHGNEPSHHITYLYAYVGEPWKTADKVRYILDSLYSDRSDGLCGNEDVGQMSAWYIFSALGFYPVNPSNGLYVFGSPVVNRAIIELENGRSLEINVKNNNGKNKYIQRISFNRKPFTRTHISHEEIMKGGVLQIDMGNQPSKTWGVNKKDRPY